MTMYYDNADTAVKNIVDQVGKKIIIGVPLGLGKPIGLLNALYRLAISDQEINLTIITGLTLARPDIQNELEKRLVEPILARILGDYEDPLYEKYRMSQTLPSNINVIEFFLSPGKYLHNQYAQQNYISSSYTKVVDDLRRYSVNVLAQQVASSNDQYSLSSNTDLFHEVASYLAEEKTDGKKVAIVAEVNNSLPFMYGEDAVVSAKTFTDIIDTKKYKSLFCLPREALSTQDHLIGLYVSTLLKDGGCIQIGIGKLGDSLANSLLFRQKNNPLYRDIIGKLKPDVAEVSYETFNEGLYASTEMFSDEYMHLFNEDVLKKRVYDHIGLQDLLNKKIITEKISPDILDVLIEYKIISSILTADDLRFLKKFGILDSVNKINIDLSNPQIKQDLIKNHLGTHLKNGKIIHAGFFLGSGNFYKQLHELSREQLDTIEMTSVARTNQLTHNPELLKLQRTDARLINFAMMITLGGATVSDGLSNIQEVSGVGGQFDFVSMARNLPGARSIIACRSTRQSGKGLQSNIIWDYNNLTIPRYFRDIFVTEYGIADCLSKTDADIMKAILNITDSRFQDSLLQKAKQFGKLPNDYQIPLPHKNNFPEKIKSILDQYRNQGYFNTYPFGSDLTDDEQAIASALENLKNASQWRLIRMLVLSLFNFKSNNKINACLVRMQLLKTKTLKEYLYKKLMIASLSRIK